MSPSYLLLLLCFYLSLKETTATACLPKTCGNLTISGPFWLTQEQVKGKPCGPVDYQVACQNNSPILWSSHVFGLAILDIFYNNRSLLVVDFHKLQDFGDNCRVPVVNTSSKLSQPFRMSSINMDLLFYSCKSPVAMPWLERGLVPMNCSNNSYVCVGGRYNAYDNYEEYLVEGCSTTVVPVLGISSKENASNYKKLISNGFLLTWTMELGPLLGSCSSRPLKQIAPPLPSLCLHARTTAPASTALLLPRGRTPICGILPSLVPPLARRGFAPFRGQHHCRGPAFTTLTTAAERVRWGGG